MKIVSLEAENYKRLKAVNITPDGDLVVVGGRNAQGKSSVLDAIWAALGGRDGNKASKPIRDGEETARVRLDLGDLIVTRTWKGDTTAGTVKVEAANGAVFRSPQTMLDSLVGRLSFDPLAFTRLSARDQRDALLGMVELDEDVEALDAQRASLFSQRTEVGREGKSLGEAPPVDESLPDAPANAADLIAKLRAVEGHNARIAAAREKVERLDDRIDLLAAQLNEVRRERAEASCIAGEASLSTAPLETDLEDIEARNNAIRANNAAKEHAARVDGLRAKYDGLSANIEELDARKAAALAGAKFPVDGLGFDEHGVTFQGVPFAQASSAEQIRVSLGMAVAANPELRVIRIMDGSLLDDDNLALIAKAAADHDMQVWVERVGTSDGMGIVIEDGEVAA